MELTYTYFGMLQPCAVHLRDLTMFEAVLLLMMLPAEKVIHLRATSFVSTYKITTRQLASALKHRPTTTTDASRSNLEARSESCFHALIGLLHKPSRAFTVASSHLAYIKGRYLRNRRICYSVNYALRDNVDRPWPRTHVSLLCSKR